MVVVDIHSRIAMVAKYDEYLSCTGIDKGDRGQVWGQTTRLEFDPSIGASIFGNGLSQSGMDKDGLLMMFLVREEDRVCFATGRGVMVWSYRGSVRTPWTCSRKRPLKPSQKSSTVSAAVL